MKRIKPSENVVELNKAYSTTRRLVENNELIKKNHNVQEEGHLLHPEQVSSHKEGGLRAKGYSKRGEPQKPLISVITAVYNGANCLEQAILSVTGQSYDNVEFIIIDGGSTDGSLDVIKRFDGVIDYWVSESDQGVYDAMNKGVSLSCGDFVLFLGSDDTLFDIFAEAVKFFENDMMSYYGNVILSKTRKSYDGRFYPLKLFRKNIPHQAIFYSRHVFDDFRYDCKYNALADYELNLRIFSNKKYGLKYIPKTIATYNNEVGISSTITDHAFSSDKQKLIKKYYPVFYYVIYMWLRFVLKRK